MTYRTVEISQIEINREKRHRGQIDTKNLRESIQTHGLFHPVVVRRRPEGSLTLYELAAGERRLTCCIELGWTEVPVRLFEDLSDEEAKIIELEENIKRADFTWQEVSRNIGEIHRLYKQRNNDQWSQQKTGDQIGLSQGQVGIYLSVLESLDDERVQQAGSVREAWNLLQRRKARQEGEALEEFLDVLRSPEARSVEEPQEASTPAVVELYEEYIAASPAGQITSLVKARPARFVAQQTEKVILHESFLHWAPKYSGRKFNLIHCDFPYGVGLFSSNGVRTGDQRSQMGRDQQDRYSDLPEDYFKLLDCLLINMDRLASFQAHLVFWFSEKHGQKTRQMFAEKAPEWSFQPFPLIWVKSDNAGIAADVRQGPRHTYETALMATRGKRNIVQVVADAYSCPTDKRYHVSAKPDAMLEHFFRMLVDDNTHLLDPSCGGGSAIRVAEKLKAGSVLGLEIDENTCGVARKALKDARSLRGIGLSQSA